MPDKNVPVTVFYGIELAAWNEVKVFDRRKDVEFSFDILVDRAYSLLCGAYEGQPRRGCVQKNCAILGVTSKPRSNLGPTKGIK